MKIERKKEKKVKMNNSPCVKKKGEDEVCLEAVGKKTSGRQPYEEGKGPFNKNWHLNMNLNLNLNMSAILH